MTRRTRKTDRLLSLDWDFWFPCIEGTRRPVGVDVPGAWFDYDWGHKEAPFFIEALWQLRAAPFLRPDRGPMGLPRVLPHPEKLWERVDVSGATLYVAESHCQIASKEIGDVAEVVSLDAHHDAGYRDMPLGAFMDKGEISCEDWALFLRLQQIGVTVRYPTWKPYALEAEPAPLVPLTRMIDDGAPLGRFERVFLCRSGSWVPSWEDEKFFAFIDSAPVKAVIHVPEPVLPRYWDQAAAERDVLDAGKLLQNGLENTERA